MAAWDLKTTPHAGQRVIGYIWYMAVGLLIAHRQIKVFDSH